MEIANAINSAASIHDILTDLKDKMLELVEAERVTIFALDTKNQELFSLMKTGQDVKEIRVPKTFASIAGFTALSRKTTNIKNAYDPAELSRFHPNLRFDQRWDKATGFRTTQVLAAPILFDKYLLGVLQLINKRGAAGLHARATRRRRRSWPRSWASPSTTSTGRPAPTSPPSSAASSTRASFPRRTWRRRSRNARVNQLDVAQVLEEDFKVPKEEILAAPGQFYACKAFDPAGPHHARRT